MLIEGTTRKNEKICASNFTSKEAKEIFNDSLGVAYIITCLIENKEYII